jgi:hypothetical protein
LDERTPGKRARTESLKNIRYRTRFMVRPTVFCLTLCAIIWGVQRSRGSGGSERCLISELTVQRTASDHFSRRQGMHGHSKPCEGGLQLKAQISQCVTKPPSPRPRRSLLLPCRSQPSARPLRPGSQVSQILSLRNCASKLHRPIALGLLNSSFYAALVSEQRQWTPAIRREFGRLAFANG